MVDFYSLLNTDYTDNLQGLHRDWTGNKGKSMLVHN